MVGNVKQTDPEKYTIDTLADKDKLPKKGIPTGSACSYVDENGEFHLYKFTKVYDTKGKEIEGRWDEI